MRVLSWVGIDVYTAWPKIGDQQPRRAALVSDYALSG